MATGLNERIEGALAGAAVGAELAWLRVIDPDRFCAKTAAEALTVRLTRRVGNPQHPKRLNFLKPTPLVALGVRTFIKQGGRVRPEDLARELVKDRAIATPAFRWDGLHTTQELLKEGMHPRLSGQGTAPDGKWCAVMPAVGVYHFGDPEAAYLDGVELASVGQPRLGADWAGLTAAAVAAALDPTATAERVIDTVLKLAHANSKEAFYELNRSVRHAGALFRDKANPDLEGWRRGFGASGMQREINHMPANPLRFVLPLLGAFSDDPHTLMAALLWPDNSGHEVNPVVAGVLLGALHGAAVFPEAWLKWARPIAKPWQGMVEVVAKRLRTERELVRMRERLTSSERGGLSLLEDKIYGCLLASSIGNAMGSVTEGQLYWEIDERHPGGVQTVLDPSRLESEDDNQMAMLLVETYLAREGAPVGARHFGRTWHERLNRDHFFPMCMGNAYDLIRAGWDPRITGHWSQVTGSTVMCMEPVGIFHLGDPENAAIDAEAISYMYQRGLDVTAAVILSSAVAEAMRPRATVEGVCRAALAAAPTTPFRTFDKRPFKSCRHYLETCLRVASRHTNVLEARADLYKYCLLYHMIDPLELLGLSLAMLHISRGDVKQAAIGGTSIGRDADTIAGRGAMLAGALRGARNVPREWMRLFEPASLTRIEDRARQLARLITEGKAQRQARRLAY